MFSHDFQTLYCLETYEKFVFVMSVNEDQLSRVAASLVIPF